MSEAEKAVGWLRAQAGESKRQRAMFERIAHILLAQQDRIDMLTRRESDLAIEVMEQRALIGAMRAVADPRWMEV